MVGVDPFNLFLCQLTHVDQLPLIGCLFQEGRIVIRIRLAIGLITLLYPLWPDLTKPKLIAHKSFTSVSPSFKTMQHYLSWAYQSQSKHIKHNNMRKPSWRWAILQAYPCYMLEHQVAFPTKIELCISIFHYKHVLQSDSKITIFIITRFYKI